MSQKFFHGSATSFEPGFLLLPRQDSYEAEWGHTDFYRVLEHFRPEGVRPHKESVFLVGEIDDIDLAGGNTDFCLEVEPVGVVTRHDINWSSEISCLMSQGKTLQSPEVKHAAEAYWAGHPHADEQVWEYLCEAARVLRCEPYETFDLDQPGF